MVVYAKYSEAQNVRGLLGTGILVVISRNMCYTFRKSSS